MPRKNILIAVAAAVAVIIIVVIVVVVTCKDKIFGNYKPTGTDWFLQDSFRLDYGDKSPFFVRPGTRLFDLSGDDDMHIRKETGFSKDDFECNTVTEYSQRLAKNLGLGGTYQGLGGAVSASTASLLKTKKTTFRQEKLETATSRSVQMHLSKVDQQASRFLEGNARKILCQREPSEIHKIFGDYYATKLVMGGIYQFTLVAERRETETAEQVKADVKGKYGVPMNDLSVDGGIATDESTRKDNFRVKARWRVLGGDTSKWLGITEKNQGKIKDRWADSINTENMQPVEYELHPIWELLEEPDMKKKCPGKGEALKSFITNRWIEELEKEKQRTNIDERLRVLHNTGKCFGRFKERFWTGGREYLREEPCRQNSESQKFFYRDSRIYSKSEEDMCLVGSRNEVHIKAGRTLWVAHCDKEGDMVHWDVNPEDNTIHLQIDGKWCLHVRPGGVLEMAECENCCTAFDWGDYFEPRVH